MKIDLGLVLVAVITAIPVGWGIWAASKRTKIVDADAARAGVTADERASVAHIQQAQKDLMATYRADIAELRTEIQYQDQRLAPLEKDRDECRLQLADVHRELDQLKRKVAENGT